MYHGTRAENGDFAVFDADKAVKKGGLGMKAMGKGNYFTSTKLNGTERYGSRVIPAYLNIRKPFIYEGGKSFQEQVGEVLHTDASEMNHDELQALLRRNGYDGIVQRNKEGDINIAVAFDSDQIKSADRNIGTFEKNDPNIYHSLNICRPHCSRRKRTGMIFCGGCNTGAERVESKSSTLRSWNTGKGQRQRRQCVCITT